MKKHNTSKAITLTEKTLEIAFKKLKKIIGKRPNYILVVPKDKKKLQNRLK